MTLENAHCIVKLIYTYSLNISQLAKFKYCYIPRLLLVIFTSITILQYTSLYMHLCAI